MWSGGGNGGGGGSGSERVGAGRGDAQSWAPPSQGKEGGNVERTCVRQGLGSNRGGNCSWDVK